MGKTQRLGVLTAVFLLAQGFGLIPGRSIALTAFAASPVGSNVQVSPCNTGSYSETMAVYDPTNHVNLFDGSNSESLPPMAASRNVTSTGCDPWTTVSAPMPTAAPNTFTADPTPAFDASGNLYYGYIGAASSVNTQLVVSKSTDKGATWSTPVVVEPPASRPDKPLMAVDTTSGAPYSHPGRLYLAYDNQVSASSQPIVVNRSDNGASWLSTGQAAYDEGGGIGAYPAVGSSGELYVLSNDFCGGLVNGACQRPAGQILISKSIDGGQTFGALPNTPQLVATTTIGSGAALTNWGNGCAGQHKVRSSPALAVDTSGGPMTGAVYVVWNDEQPSGAKMHIFFSRSLDGGATWKTAQGTTIQQIDTGNANDAWQPALAVDQSNGVVSISWYDRRDDPNNKLYKVYYSQSADGGGSFTAPIAVSTAQSDPTLTCSATGDYMSVVSVDGIAHPFWTDNRSNINQIWTAPITESVIGGGCQTIPVAAGWASSYALTKQGNVWAWGNNGSGQLGQGSPGPSGSSTPIEVVAPAGQSGYLSGIRSISAGQYFALALKSADGSVWGWGQGGDGELGQGGTNRSDSPTPVQVTAPSGSGYLLGVIAISAGDNFSVALRGDGTVWTWGNNVYGQLGNPTDYGSTIAVVTTPVEVVGPSGTGNLTNIVAISAGSTHVLALDASNQVWAWGSDGWGALGNSPPTPGYAPILTTAPAGQQGNLTASAVVPGENGGEHSLAMESTGIVYAWGENDHGQLGLGTTDTNIHQTPAQVLGSAKNTFLTGVGAIGAGGYHSLAVKSANGAVVTWGYNMYGQLGNGNSGSRADSNKPVSVLGPGGSGSLTGMMLAIGGTWHSLAEASSGTSLWAWGYNLDGELGNGGTANSSFPVQVSGLTGITTPLLCA